MCARRPGVTLAFVLAACNSLVCAAQSTAAERAWKLHLFSESKANSSGARCLDGTPSGYYLSEGDPGSQTWVVYLQGGGFCNSTKPCTSNPNDISCQCRLTWTWGTSTLWDKHIPPALDDAASSLEGILSPNVTANPGFHNAHRVFVPYCDGTLWTGRSRSPLDGLYFAGHLTLQAVMLDLAARGANSSTSTVVLTGMSAGGVGSLVHANWAAALLPSARVVVMAGGGFFLFSETYLRHGYSGFDNNWGRAAMDVWIGGDRTAVYVDETCAAKFPAGQRYKCLEGPTAYAATSTPVFIAENRFDPAQLYFDGGDMCPGTWDGFDAPTKDCAQKPANYLIDFGRNMTVQLQQGPALNGGVFSPSCVNHVRPFDALWYRPKQILDSMALRVEGYSLHDAFIAWLSGKQIVLLETCKDPHHQPCNANAAECTKPCEESTDHVQSATHPTDFTI